MACLRLGGAVTKGAGRGRFGVASTREHTMSSPRVAAVEMLRGPPRRAGPDGEQGSAGGSAGLRQGGGVTRAGGRGSGVGGAAGPQRTSGGIRPRNGAKEQTRGDGDGEGRGLGDGGPTERVTLGLRGVGRRPSESFHAFSESATPQDAPCPAAPEPEEDPFARMDPAQARAARIRRDRAIAAKAVAQQKLAERAGRQAQEAERASHDHPAIAAPAHLSRETGPAVRLVHGQHFPHGFEAVEHMYGSEGTWKRIGEVRYDSNLFREHASEAHPLDPETLEDACSRLQHTCCDADGNIMFDPGRLGKVQQCCGAFAFHEHSGLAGSGRRGGRMRLLFNFDDNVLGHCVSQIYSKPAPSGVDASDANSMNQTFCRWQAVVNGSPKSPVSAYLTSAWFSRVEALWKNNSKIQQTALKGLYHVINGSLSEGFLAWQWLREHSGAEYDGSMYHFVYKRLVRTSDVALFKILTAALLAADLGTPSIFSEDARQLLVDHCVALRVVLLNSVVETAWMGPSPNKRVNYRGGMRAAQGRGGMKRWASGWVESTDGLGGSGYVDSGATFLAILALGACCSMVFEPGISPLLWDDKGYILRHHVLSASNLKNNMPGLMVAGPFWNFPPGHYRVDYYLRARAPHHTPTSTNDKMTLPPGDVCTLEVRDAGQCVGDDGGVLCSRVLQPGDFGAGNHWSRLSCQFVLTNALNALDFRVAWHGNASLDISSLSISASA